MFPYLLRFLLFILSIHFIHWPIYLCIYVLSTFKPKYYILGFRDELFLSAMQPCSTLISDQTFLVNLPTHPCFTWPASFSSAPISRIGSSLLTVSIEKSVGITPALFEMCSYLHCSTQNIDCMRIS